MRAADRYAASSSCRDARSKGPSSSRAVAAAPSGKMSWSQRIQGGGVLPRRASWARAREMTANRHEHVWRRQQGRLTPERQGVADLLAQTLGGRVPTWPDRKSIHGYPVPIFPPWPPRRAPYRRRIVRSGGDHTDRMSTCRHGTRPCPADRGDSRRLRLVVVAPEIDPHRCPPRRPRGPSDPGSHSCAPSCPARPADGSGIHATLLSRRRQSCGVSRAARYRRDAPIVYCEA